MKHHRVLAAATAAVAAIGPAHAASVLSGTPTILLRGTLNSGTESLADTTVNLRATPYRVTGAFSGLSAGTPINLRATPYRVTGTFSGPGAGTTIDLRAAPNRVTGAFTGLAAGSGTTDGLTLLNSAGFVNGSQVFSDAITIPSAGTLTVTLAGLSWLDALQNLNCFVSTPGGGILGNATNGTVDTVNVQPGTLYVNWYAQAGSPLFLGAYSINVNLLPTTPPPTVPLPPALPLLVCGLAALGLGLRWPRMSPAAT